MIFGTMDGGYEPDIRALFDRYSDMVYKIAVSQMKNRANADDVFQEVFLRLVRYADRIKSEEHAKAWLIRVTLNCCKKQFGSAWNRRTTELPEQMSLTQGLQEEYLELYDAVNRLPEDYRIVVHLFYYEGYSVEEIARLLGRKQGTVKSQLFRARGLLRSVWEGDDELG